MIYWREDLGTQEVIVTKHGEPVSFCVLADTQLRIAYRYKGTMASNGLAYKLDEPHALERVDDVDVVAKQ